MTAPQKKLAVNWILVVTLATFILGLTLNAGIMREEVTEAKRVNQEQNDEIHGLRELLYDIKGDVKVLLRRTEPKDGSGH